MEKKRNKFNGVRICIVLLAIATSQITGNYLHSQQYPVRD